MKKLLYADDDHENVKTLFKMRYPSLMFGLFLGMGISFVTSSFEEVISHNVQVAFFLPFIIYIADAVGAQTGSIYTRDLKSGKASFKNYLNKELRLGIIFGLVFGLLSSIFTLAWLKDELLSLSILVSSFITISTAPFIALLIAQGFQKLKKDPAVSTGPIATIIQDMISVIVYGAVTTIIIL